MSPIPLERLEDRLAELTSSGGGDGLVWRGAANEAGLVRSKPPSWAATFSAPVPTRALSIFAAALVIALTVGVLLPSLGSARRAPRGLASNAVAERVFVGDNATGTKAVPASAPQSPAMDRRVIQRGTIEVRVADVAATFTRLQSLLSQAGGEYIEQSSLSGTGSSTVGTATLRIAAKRLGFVQAAVAEWGVVTSQTSAGEDVTDQSVDLEARLTVERRVERELLELLDTRKGAPLKEVLEVREQLNSVRTQIERLTAQQTRLDALVSLATLTVTLRASEPVPAAVAPPGILGYAKQTLADAWARSLTSAIDSLAWLVSMLVGGVFVWIALGLGVVVLLRVWRSIETRAAHEPAPRLGPSAD